MSEDLKLKVEALTRELAGTRRDLVSATDSATEASRDTEHAVLVASAAARTRAENTEWDQRGRLVDLAGIARARNGEGDADSLRNLALALEQPGPVGTYPNYLRRRIAACPESLAPLGHPAREALARDDDGVTVAWEKHGQWVELEESEPFPGGGVKRWYAFPRAPFLHIDRLLGRLEHLSALATLRHLTGEQEEELDLLQWWNQERLLHRSQMVERSRVARAEISDEVGSLRAQLATAIATSEAAWAEAERREHRANLMLLGAIVTGAIVLVGFISALSG